MSLDKLLKLSTYKTRGSKHTYLNYEFYRKGSQKLNFHSPGKTTIKMNLLLRFWSGMLRHNTFIFLNKSKCSSCKSLL